MKLTPAARRAIILSALVILLLAVAAGVYLTIGYEDEDAEPLGAVGDGLGRIRAIGASLGNGVRGMSGNYRENRRKIGEAVERYRGAMPWGALMAICEHESNFNPDAYNPTEVIRGGVSLGHARGAWQILDGYQSDYGVTAATVTEIDASTRGACNVRQRSHASITSLAPEALESLRDYTYLLYLSHFAGRGGMEKMIARARSRGAVTADTVGGYGHEVGLKATADRAVYWESIKGEILA